jgi:signal transduction histidine kinase
VRPLSIRLRITVAFALAMALVLGGTGVFLYERLSTHLAGALDRELATRGQDLAVLVDQPGASLSHEGASSFVERGERYAQLLTPGGRVLDATEPLGRAPLLRGQVLAAAARAPLLVTEPAVRGLDEPSRVLGRPVTVRGRRLVLAVGETEGDDAEILATFRAELLLAFPIALLLASAAGFLLAGLSLRQVESMRRRAAAISERTPGERLPVPRTGDELQRLGETLNGMLDRLESALERERDLLADAGHELRTPLALLRTELELAERQGGSPDELRQAIRSSSHEAERLSQLAEDLLLIARADRGRLPLRVEQLDVEALLAAVASRYAWRAGELGKAVHHEAPAGLRVEGDRLRLEQALGNLVDNALRHGGRDVSLTARSGDGLVELHVRDDGEGLPQQFLARAFDRFARPHGARSGGGSGLGLAIVRTIAESHQGSAHVANRRPCGADAWLSLPLASV